MPEHAPDGIIADGIIADGIILDSIEFPDGDHDLMGRFESVGDNCEFGIVQRFAGAEPLGLFRFNHTPIDSLIRGLEGRFHDLALTGQVEVEWQDEWIVSETLYEFRYNTSNHDRSLDAERLAAEHARWMRCMAEMFMQRLATADRIFVRKGEGPEAEPAIRHLHAAMRQYGNATLLWVRTADQDHPSGSVEWLETGLMLGWLGGFAPYDRVMEVNPTDWLRLCRRAWALAFVGDANAYPRTRIIAPGPLSFGGWSGSDVATARFDWTVPPPAEGQHVMLHRLVEDVPTGRDIFGCLIDRDLTAGGLYKASAQVLLPHDFTGTNVGLDLLGRPAFQSGRIDLNRRGAWQTIWVKSLLSVEGAMAFPRLVLAGPRGTSLHTADWRLDACPIPP